MILTLYALLARIFHELSSRDREDGRATGQSRETAGLDPRRTCTVRRRVRHPRTPGRTLISAVVVTPWRDELFGLIYGKRFALGCKGGAFYEFLTYFIHLC